MYENKRYQQLAGNLGSNDNKMHLKAWSICY
jgi:hypothetical protein